MQDDISDDMKPVYSSYSSTYTGVCIGGPKNGETYYNTELTAFVPRKVKKKPSDYIGRSLMGLSLQERTALVEQEKALMKETLWAKKHPHRYDFDLHRKVWVYVEYTITPMEGEE